MMIRRYAKTGTVVLFCCLLHVCLAHASSRASCTGVVCYEDSSPAPGVAIYALDLRHKLEVTNNRIMVDEHIPRTLSDVQGRFTLNVMQDDVWLFARDLEDRCAFASVRVGDRNSAKLIISEPAAVKAQLFKGDEPVKGQTVTARYIAERPFLRYVHKTKTNQNGEFEFDALMPGEYLFQVIEEVPPVGCCFRSVVTKQLKVTLRAKQEKQIKFGGTGLPFLHGKITDTNSNGLHGVWVRLEPKVNHTGSNALNDDEVVFSDVTARDGSYRIFDIPPGKYTLRCFRRLVLNDYGRTLQATEDVFIRGLEKNTEAGRVPVENVYNVSIDLAPFMPLQCGQKAPELSGKLLSGEDFSLDQWQGRVVVLHFYASWCVPCVSSAPFYDELADKFGEDKLAVLGISLDNSLGQCKSFVEEKGIQHSQLFAGPWRDSTVRKAFRVVNVPTTFIIDRYGEIAQIDLFDATLENFIRKLLEND